MTPIRPLLRAAALLTLQLTACSAFDAASFKLPPGFSISVWADNLPNARSLAVSNVKKYSIVFVGSRGAGPNPASGTPDDKVWAVVDKDLDGRADYATVLLSGYPNPNGVAYSNGSLYVGLPTTILRLDDVNTYALTRKPYDKPPVVVADFLPPDVWHGSKYLSFGLDGKLYFGIGVPCDDCVPPPPYQKDAASPKFTWGSLYRMSPDGTGVELWASGVRNSVGFDWHPTTNELYWTDNGSNEMGDNLPDDELNYAPQQGMSFGFPFCLTTGAGGINVRPTKRLPGVGPPYTDPKLNPGGSVINCDAPGSFTPAIQALGPHIAALGMRFYNSDKYPQAGSSAFPKKYDGNIFIAMHGSGGRSIKLGYNVMRVVLDKTDRGKVARFDRFVSGWLVDPGSPNATFTGRPVDVLQLRDGSMLISDDFAGMIYRVSYSKPT